MRRWQAFTLIELLVVSVIITILLSILIGPMRSARDAGKHVVCLSQTRQIGLGAAMYAQEHDEFLPSGTHPHIDIARPHGHWLGDLRPYLDNARIYRCPSDLSPYFEQPQDGRTRQTSYALNYYLSGQLPGYETMNRLSRLPDPQANVLAVELTEIGSLATADHVHPEQWWYDPQAEPLRQVAGTRHGGRANYLFADGHAETLSIEETYTLDLNGSSFGNLIFQRNFYDPLSGQ